MGYTGRIFLFRGDESWIPAQADVLERQSLPGGWSLVTFDGDPEVALKAVVDATGTPALSAFVIDSDCADVSAQSPNGVTWRTYLHEEMAYDYGAPALQQTQEEVTDGAVAWSNEAGFHPDPDAIAEALADEDVQVEDTLDTLLTALGVQSPPNT